MVGGREYNGGRRLDLDESAARDCAPPWRLIVRLGAASSQRLAGGGAGACSPRKLLTSRRPISNPFFICRRPATSRLVGCKRAPAWREAGPLHLPPGTPPQGRQWPGRPTDDNVISRPVGQPAAGRRAPFKEIAHNSRLPEGGLHYGLMGLAPGRLRGGLSSDILSAARAPRLESQTSHERTATLCGAPAHRRQRRRANTPPPPPPPRRPDLSEEPFDKRDMLEPSARAPGSSTPPPPPPRVINMIMRGGRGATQTLCWPPK
jgi:hypothetical protein